MTSRKATSAASATEGSAKTRVRVLIVEDNPISSMVATQMVLSLGLEAKTAANGLEALEAMDRQTFDLVLMDCQMPEMDGYEATAEIRRREGPGTHTPIVALTAHTLKGERERCLAAGMDDFLAKPLTVEQLADVLSSWVKIQPVPG